MVLFRRLFRDEEGADAAEYALLAGAIAIAIIAGATVLGKSIGDFFSALGGYIGAVQVG